VDYSQGDAAEQIWEMCGGDGVQKAVEAVGCQAHTPDGAEDHPVALEGCVKVCNPTGRIGCVGVFIIGDPGAENEVAQQGIYPFPIGSFFMKGLTVGMGQANVKQYNRYLRDLIVAGKAIPSQIVSHEIPLRDAPDAYDKFDKRVDGYTKVVIKPAA
jgi:glutathione-independent formaldehyde dehydrogenase